LVDRRALWSLGGASFSLKWLYHSLAWREWNRDRIIWRLPVEVRGSILGHAYHQLLEAGVVVFTAEPSKKVLEVREGKAFDKLVRDQIPDVAHLVRQHAPRRVEDVKIEVDCKILNPLAVDPGQHRRGHLGQTSTPHVADPVLESLVLD
jgi:hypothetical protein